MPNKKKQAKPKKLAAKAMQETIGMIQPDPTTQRRIASMVSHAKTIGLQSFVLGFIDQQGVQLHYEQLRITDMFRVAIFMFRNAIVQELANDKAITDKQRAVYRACDEQFAKLIADTNKKLKP